MRKRLSIVITITMLMVILFGINAYAVDQKIYDEADIFSQMEEEELQAKAYELSEKIKLDTVILTIEDNKGKSSRAYADDFYDENGFGYGESYDGLVLLIDMGSREIYISTCGKAIEYFTDARIDSILDKVYIYLSEGNYSLGAEAFLNEVEYYFQKGIPSTQHTYDEDTGIINQGSTGTSNSSQKEDIAGKLLIFLLISLVVGGISVGIMAINNKGNISTNQSTYLDRNSFKLVNSLDRHVDTRVTFVHINKESKTGSSSAGRSTIHKSSSGRSHGGGGRKF